MQKHTHNLWEQAHECIQQEQFTEAIVRLELLLHKEPQHIDALYWLAFCFLHIHHPYASLEALKTYQELSEELPEQVVETMLMATFDATLFEEALEIAEQGRDIFPQNPFFWQYTGFIIARTSTSKARPFFTQAFALAPEACPTPKSLPRKTIFAKACSWLPKEAQEWANSLDVQYSMSPSNEILNQEEFPQHPLIPFLLEENTIYIFRQNLCYLPRNESATSALFEYLLAYWNQDQ